ncbi:hypothetical protein BDN72DRAFT_898213 [Pluteus cervinus]|uniref:Uncharacterized protein n=1 Tax=Pluteus cervinus TaxID=181527 RepID=A0ACD3AS22_9AGAR|nr:hypothetical protein BDN72DRAFT_898213 [Pluteus cervinus]
MRGPSSSSKKPSSSKSSVTSRRNREPSPMPSTDEDVRQGKRADRKPRRRSPSPEEVSLDFESLCIRAKEVDDLPTRLRWYAVVRGNAIGVVQGWATASTMRNDSDDHHCRAFVTEERACAYFRICNENEETKIFLKY